MLATRESRPPSAPPVAGAPLLRRSRPPSALAVASRPALCILLPPAAICASPLALCSAVAGHLRLCARPPSVPAGAWSLSPLLRCLLPPPAISSRRPLLQQVAGPLLIYSRRSCLPAVQVLPSSPAPLPSHLYSSDLDASCSLRGQGLRVRAAFL